MIHASKYFGKHKEIKHLVGLREIPTSTKFEEPSSRQIPREEIPMT